MSFIIRFFFLAAGVLSVAMAQSNFGGIKGTVTDTSGAVIPGARVEITDTGTNARITLTTAADGTYSAPALRPVYYDIAVEAQGFQKTFVRQVKVDTAKLQTVDVTLRPGEVTATVDVSAEAPLLQTYTGAVTNTVDTRTINEAPSTAATPSSWHCSSPAPPVTPEARSAS